jgi:hypothetical protein
MQLNLPLSLSSTTTALRCEVRLPLLLVSSYYTQHYHYTQHYYCTQHYYNTQHYYYK